MAPETPDSPSDESRTLAGSGRRPRTIVPRSTPPPSAERASPTASPGASPAAGETSGQPSGDEAWGGFSTTERESLRGRWRQLQGEFVDDPAASVRDADALVAETLRTLQQRLTDHHKALEAQWSTTDADTEQLRHTIRRYRAFLNSMLAAGD